MLVAIGNYNYISIEDPVYREIVYNLNGNDPAKTLIPPYNGADTSEKFIGSVNLIYLVKPLVKSHT